ncbi:hypothetical protein CCACVL1_19631 [Corchorus capsularis]|uniref:DUF2828 domain-containing protein n=1 Tax=Corchorus capsularis TaxID=210143 RepID=A0A1R3HFT8_COCAP|nr:hypothetical protein CCACVL1_19631 [Corchorus capsularis]
MASFRFDKSTLLCEGVAKKMFPRENYPEYEAMEEAHYVYRVRDRLRKEVLVPLHKVLELVSELSEKPWKGKLITFSANPQLQMVQGKNKLIGTYEH